MKKNDKKEKKIRKLLLINSDQEMQKKIKKKNSVLINSMTPLELENSFQLYKDRVNTSVSTYINVLEKHIVLQVVDINKNINYYYSDFIENKKRRVTNQKYNKYKGVYSAKNINTNFGDLIDGEEESEENEEDEKEEKEEEIIKSIIPFINKKRSVGAGKIVKDKSYSLVSPVNNFKNKEDLNNICIDTCDCKSNDHHVCEKQKNRKKMLDMNYKLIYYCYTNLKRKRPLITQNNYDNNVTINELYGLEIEEEYFDKMKRRTSTYKENKISNKLNNNILRPVSSKNVNGSMKKVKKNKTMKHIHKKNKRGCVTSKNGNNNHISNFTNVLNNLKSKLERYISIKSDKKSIIKKNRLSQDHKTDKIKTKSSIKKHKKTNSNDNKIINVGESPFQNFMSKLDTKTTSFDENSSSVENKNKIKNSKRKESNINSKNKEATKNLKKDNNERRKIKYITDSKLKHKCFEELKIRVNYKPNKKSLVEPIRSQFMNSLRKKVGFNFEENKKNNFYKNKALSKLSLVKKRKSKSKKDCPEYVDNFDDELFYKNKNGSYNIKDNNITSFHSKKIVQ